jgi:sialic acid synthase SpsE
MLFQVIERHITLDRNMKGSDHICSLDPSQFSKLVRDIRYIEKNLAI